MNQFLPKKRFLNINPDIQVQGCQRNDLHCQQQLYKLFYPDMIKICYRYTKNADEAGSIYNDAMLRVFKSIAKYNHENKLGGWIKTIIVHCCIDFCKKQTLFKEVAFAQPEDCFEIEPDVFNKISGKEIQIIVKQLPVATATVFNLFLYEGFTHKQIGEILNISDSTSKWHVSEAKRILKSKVGHFFKKEFKVNAAG